MVGFISSVEKNMVKDTVSSTACTSQIHLEMDVSLDCGLLDSSSSNKVESEVEVDDLLGNNSVNFSSF